MEKLTYTLAEAAEVVGVSAVTMGEWVQMDDFPAMRAGKKWIIGKEQFREWIKRKIEERAVIKEGCYVNPKDNEFSEL